MDVDIDLNTGLPEVSGGLVWSVERMKDRGDGKLLSITLSRKVESTVNKVQSRKVRSWKTLWIEKEELYQKTTTKTKMNVIYSRAMSNQIWIEKEEYNEYLNDGWIFLQTRKLKDAGSQYLMEKAWEPTPENVLDAARQIWDRYLKDLDEAAVEANFRATQDAIIGTYPPKKLEN